MQGFSEFTEEKKIVVKTKMGGEIPATIKVTGKDYHIVKTASGKQYKVDHQGNSLEEEIDDKDLPFTPDKKPTKPSTPGKYGSAYSTVRNLARKALEKQKQVKEEVDLQEAKSKDELNALMRKHEQHAIDANKRGDDAAVVKHQQHISNIKKKLERVVRNEEVELEEGHVPDDRGRVLTPSDKEKLGKVADLMAKEKAAKQKQVKEAAPVAPSVGVHRIQVTVSDPDHTMVSQRKEKVQKFVRVTSNSKEHALEQGKKHFAKKGWKVHDAEHVGMVHEEVDLEEGKKGYAPGWMLKADPELAKKVKANTQGYKDLKKYAGKDIPKKEVAEGYRGNSEADKPYFDAQDHKTAAEKAHKEGDNFSYHMHMAAHHDSMAHWNANKGRHHVADLHMSKAENHEHYAQQARKESK